MHILNQIQCQHIKIAITIWVGLAHTLGRRLEKSEGTGSLPTLSYMPLGIRLESSHPA